MTDTEEAATDFDEKRVPDDIHPDDVENYLRKRFSRSTLSDTAVREFAEVIADRRRRQNRVPSRPRDVGEPSEGEATARSDIDMGEITYDSSINMWRDKETGQFIGRNPK